MGIVQACRDAASSVTKVEWDLDVVADTICRYDNRPCIAPRCAVCPHLHLTAIMEEPMTDVSPMPVEGYIMDIETYDRLRGVMTAMYNFANKEHVRGGELRDLANRMDAVLGFCLPIRNIEVAEITIWELYYPFENASQWYATEGDAVRALEQRWPDAARQVVGGVVDATTYAIVLSTGEFGEWVAHASVIRYRFLTTVELCEILNAREAGRARPNDDDLRGHGR